MLPSKNTKLIVTSNDDVAFLQRNVQTFFSIGNTKFNLNDYNYLPTVKYRHIIEKFAKNLNEQCGFDRFAILIVYNNKRYWLSNTYNDLAIPHDIFHLSQLDLSTMTESYINKDHFFPSYDIVSPVYDLYKTIIQNFYNFYTIYTLVRICFDCHVLLYAGTSKQLLKLAECDSVYQTTYKQFEQFVITFLDQTINCMLLYSQNLTNARIYYDRSFRERLIRREYIENIYCLSEREMACLHWASLGKTAEDTASILKISPYTVREYLKEVIKKLQVSNIASAVYKAKSLNLV